MRTIRTPENEQAFLDRLAECGSAMEAAKKAKISRNALYQWKAEDPEFADKWEVAMVRGLDAIEDKAHLTASLGSERMMIFMLERRRPERYMARQAVDYNTNVTVELRRAPIDSLQAELLELIALARGGDTKIIDLKQPLSARTEVAAIDFDDDQGQ